MPEKLNESAKYNIKVKDRISISHFECILHSLKEADTVQQYTSEILITWEAIVSLPIRKTLTLFSPFAVGLLALCVSPETPATIQFHSL